MFSCKAELDTAVSNVAHNISVKVELRVHFTDRYRANMSPDRDMLRYACISAKVPIKDFDANQVNTFFSLVEQNTARRLDLDLRRYKPVNVVKERALLDANQEVPKCEGASVGYKINLRKAEEATSNFFFSREDLASAIGPSSLADSVHKASIAAAKEVKLARAFFSQPTRPTFEENKPMSLEVTRPVLVGSTDILTASDEQLVRIIREAERQIKADEDIAKRSTKFKKKAEELREVIALCIQQLDDEAAIVDKK